jgi:hypothetical protein
VPGLLSAVAEDAREPEAALTEANAPAFEPGCRRQARERLMDRIGR